MGCGAASLSLCFDHPNLFCSLEMSLKFSMLEIVGNVVVDSLMFKVDNRGSFLDVFPFERLFTLVFVSILSVH